MKIDCEMGREKDRGGGERLKKKGGKREQEGKRRRIAENSRPRNPAFSLRRLKINATTHRFPVPLATPLRIVISTRLSFTRVHRSLSRVDLFSVLSLSLSLSRLLFPHPLPRNEFTLLFVVPPARILSLSRSFIGRE